MWNNAFVSVSLATKKIWFLQKMRMQVFQEIINEIIIF